MFGSRKIQELEYKLREATESLDKANREKKDLEQRLSEASSRIAGLEEKLTDTDLEQLKKDARTSLAEYEGLKELYTRKIREFEDSIDEKEQAFAKEDARKRFDLENEIQDSRQANQDFVSDTVKQFSESYNYYLSQIRLMMDALGDIAVQTGKTLFSEEHADRNLMTSIGEEMVARLKTDTDSLRTDENENGLVLIGNIKEEVVTEEEPLGEFCEEEPAEEECGEEALSEEEPAAEIFEEETIFAEEPAAEACEEEPACAEEPAAEVCEEEPVCAEEPAEEACEEEPVCSEEPAAEACEEGTACAEEPAAEACEEENACAEEPAAETCEEEILPEEAVTEEQNEAEGESPFYG